jgi:GH15 family glucan-1,4-alpha-glucosidase
MAYKPIRDYGVIGNMRSAALVADDGSIDWLCFPRFDSPSIFAAILDDDKGGRFRIRPAGDVHSNQRYLADSNILVTDFQNGAGKLSVTDFMPVPGGDDDGTSLIRMLRCEGGSVQVDLEFTPKLDYARGPTTMSLEHGIVLAHSGDSAVSLSTDLPLERRNGSVVSQFRLTDGQTAAVSLDWLNGTQLNQPSFLQASTEMDRTLAFWRGVAGDWEYTGRWGEVVRRSMLALHLLIYAPTGAGCAAATTSLPERIGGERNWDYRYSWLRDAAFTMDAFHRLGHTSYTRPFIEWMTRVALCDRGHDVHSLFEIGRDTDPHAMTEYELSHFEGYRGSGPVRIGNAAYYQFQLDVYGEVLLALDSYQRAGGEIDDATWGLAECLVQGAIDNWQRPDHGIWEFRTDPRHFTYSKVMAWVALDRGIRLALALKRPVDFDAWRRTREQIRADITENGWSPERGSFVQCYEGAAVDASLLFLPMVGFLPADDPRIVATVETIRRELGSDGMIWRYDPDEAQDGLHGSEGTFTMCSLWLAGSLVAAGRIKEAQDIFERVIGFSGPLGLYSEMLDPSTGEFLGNYPQAFTHIGMIHTARNLDRALNAVEQGKTVAA